MELSTILWSLAIGLLLVGFAVLAFLVIQRQRQKVTQSVLLDVLEPIAWQGIAAALTIAKKASADLRVEIDGWDKAAIANATYDLFGDVLVFGRVIPVSLVKVLITRAVWVDFVKRTYDAFRAWELSNETYLTNQIAALKDPPPIAPGVTLPLLPLPAPIEIDPTLEG